MAKSTKSRSQDKPKKTILELPGLLRGELHEHLVKLSEDPEGLGHPSVTPPHPPGRLVYEFNAVHDGQLHFFTIFFLFG